MDTRKIADEKESRRAMLIGPDSEECRVIRDALQCLGFKFVIRIESFNEAKQMLLEQPPELMIVSVRLEAFNGLHLVLHGRFKRPGMAAIVIADAVDYGLEPEAKKMNAIMVHRGASREEWIETIHSATKTSTPTAAIQSGKPFIQPMPTNTTIH